MFVNRNIEPSSCLLGGGNEQQQQQLQLHTGCNVSKKMKIDSTNNTLTTTTRTSTTTTTTNARNDNGRSNDAYISELEYQVNTMYGQIKELELLDIDSTSTASVSSTSTLVTEDQTTNTTNNASTMKGTLEFKRTLNTNILELQANKEQRRVQDLLTKANTNINTNANDNDNVTSSQTTSQTQINDNVPILPVLRSGSKSKPNTNVNTDTNTEETKAKTPYHLLPTPTKQSTTNQHCLLCLQTIPQPKRYDDTVIEYFTCCGQSICKSCHIKHISSCENHDHDHDHDDHSSIMKLHHEYKYDYQGHSHDHVTASSSSSSSSSNLEKEQDMMMNISDHHDQSYYTSIITNSPKSTATSNVTMLSSTSEPTPASTSTVISTPSSPYVTLLNNHKCPFCQTPWAENESIDSNRLLQLAQQGHDENKNKNKVDSDGNNNSQSHSHSHNTNDKSWAQVEIARRYEHGMGIEPCEEKAAKWFLIAANQNNPSGQYNIGRFYKWGMMVHIHDNDDDDDENENDNNTTNQSQQTLAKEYFLKAARQGHAKAQHDLATILLDECKTTMTTTMTTAQNEYYYDQAIYWYTLSLLQGYDEALYALGNLYLMKGKNSSHHQFNKALDLGCAIYWLRQSAEKGLARGQMLLGMALLENTKNIYGSNLFQYTCSGYNIVPEVFFWLRKSASNGELDAGTRLKNCQNVHLKQCAYCHQTGDLLQWKKCDRCCGVSYCSSICQKKDWEGGHSHDCYEDPLIQTSSMERCVGADIDMFIKIQ